MLQAVNTIGSSRLSFVSKFTMYILASGEIVVIAGNQRLIVTPDEARGIMEYCLELPFRLNINGHQQEREM